MSADQGFPAPPSLEAKDAAPARAGSAGSSDEQPPEAAAGPQGGGLLDVSAAAAAALLMPDAAASKQVPLSCWRMLDGSDRGPMLMHVGIGFDSSHAESDGSTEQSFMQFLLSAAQSHVGIERASNRLDRSSASVGAAGPGGAAGGAAAHARAERRRPLRARRPVFLEPALHPALPHGAALHAAARSTSQPLVPH